MRVEILYISSQIITQEVPEIAHQMILIPMVGNRYLDISMMVTMWVEFPRI